MSDQKKLIQYLRNAGHESFMDIQQKSIEGIQSHNNQIVYSKTGSGKTLAFLFSVLSKIDPSSNDLQALILAPSRELVLQIEDVFRSLKTGYKVTVCYGGHSVKTEADSLSQAPSVVIGTPGRVCDHIERENLILSNCSFLVIDEFDKCLELGFSDEMRFICSAISRPKYRMLASATKMDELPSYLNFQNPHVIDAIVEDEEINITEYGVEAGEDILLTMSDLIKSFGDEKSIVFCNYREVSEDVSYQLKDLGVHSVYYHGGLEQDERERALIKFRNGSSNVLVCTDLGARGLDIPEINHIIHYQYPGSEQAFVHRKGRTARMASDGNSYLFIGNNQQLPEYIESPTSFYTPTPTNQELIPAWQTLYFSGGKKDKINKIDIVGFLSKKGGLKQNEIGLITVQDRSTYVAIKSNKIKHTLSKIKNEKIKGKKLKIAVSK